MSQSQWDLYDNLCKKCFIKLCNPTKKEIKKIVFSEENERCSNCGKLSLIVDYLEE